MYNVATKQRRDINAAKLEGIISKLGPLAAVSFENGFLQNYNNLAKKMQPTSSIQDSLALFFADYATDCDN